MKKRLLTSFLACLWITLSLPSPAVECGKLKSGEYLLRGQSVASCEGNAYISHQTDGNVVLYGPNGWLWQSGTSGKMTTIFIMQTDGNLVLYNGGTPLWHSGTNGNWGAFLAIQGDCNMVVYTATSVPKWAASWASPNWKACSPPSGRKLASGVDMLAFMRNTSGKIFRDDRSKDIVKFYETTRSPNLFWYMKNPFDGKRWEQYRYDADKIYLERDNSWPDGGPGSTSYDIKKGLWIWAKRKFSGVGDSVDSNYTKSS